MGIWGAYLNNVLRVFTHGLRVCNTVLLSASARNAVARAVRVPSVLKHIPGLPALGFYLDLYVSKYHVRLDDALPGGILCDSRLYFVIRATNKLESVFGSTNREANKSAFTCLWGVNKQQLY